MGRIKKESPNEGTETVDSGFVKTYLRQMKIKKESPNEGTETYQLANYRANFHLIKKESPNEGTETLISSAVISW